MPTQPSPSSYSYTFGSSKRRDIHLTGEHLNRNVRHKIEAEEEDLFESAATMHGKSTEELQFELGKNIENRSLEGIKSCLAKGAQLSLPAHPNGMFPLTIAVSVGKGNDFSLAEFLIGRNPECVTFESEESVAPLFAALMMQNVEWVRFLLSHGANPFISGDNSGPSLFDYLNRLSSCNPIPQKSREVLALLESIRRNDSSGFSPFLK